MPSLAIRISFLNTLLLSLLPPPITKITTKLLSFIILPLSWLLHPPTPTPTPTSQERNFNIAKQRRHSDFSSSSSSSICRRRVRGRTMDPAELKRVFQMFDRNGDGRITKKELSDSLGNLGIYIAEGELEPMIERIDANGDGCIDMEEFGALYETIMMEERGDEEEEEMREAFNVFDQNGDGYITVEELRSVLASLGLKQGRTAEDCRRMIGKVDVDGDGMVNFKEFKQMMRGGGFAALT